MREMYWGWSVVAATLLFIWFAAKFVINKKKNVGGERSSVVYKMPPGSRGWPLIGHSLSWYNSVAGPHPPRFVHQHALKYGADEFTRDYILFCACIYMQVLISLNKLNLFCNRFGKIFSCSLFGKWAVVSADSGFNRFIMQNEGKLFQSSYPKSFRDLVGKNGVITVQGEQQRKLHSIASNMMRLEKLKFHFLKDIQMIMLQTLGNFANNQVILLQDVCRKASPISLSRR